MAEAGIVSKEGATDFELEPGQWGELDEDGVFAWNAPDGTPLIQDFGEPGGEGLASFDSAEITLPPDRVRFATLVNLKEVGAESYFEGVLVNLSTQGVACVSSHQLSGGAQVWITFRLGLADEPVSILCEVVWERVSDEAEPGYGLKFVDIADDVRERIEEVVRERSEGRAVEWPGPTRFRRSPEQGSPRIPRWSSARGPRPAERRVPGSVRAPRHRGWTNRRVRVPGRSGTKASFQVPPGSARLASSGGA